MNRRGFGVIEILIVVAVVALAGYFIMQYVGSTAKTVEQLQKDRPIDRSKLTADRATLGALQGLVRNYQAEKGQWPPDKATVLGLLMAPPSCSAPGTTSPTIRPPARSASRSATTRAAEAALPLAIRIDRCGSGVGVAGRQPGQRVERLDEGVEAMRDLDGVLERHRQLERFGQRANLRFGQLGHRRSDRRPASVPVGGLLVGVTHP
jgi:prepilin-type N-terminal cleavage/methylation domain-containing protein